MGRRKEIEDDDTESDSRKMTYICLSNKHAPSHYFKSVKEYPPCPICKGLFGITVYSFTGDMPNLETLKREYDEAIEVVKKSKLKENIKVV